jgi:hypothetical protein
MINKYLLYIDVLGFRNLVEEDASKVNKIYKILDSLNVHRHDVFETIVFSDTVIVYNHEEPKTERDHKYIVWYSIEFVEDLHHRLTAQEIYFRSILTYGQFNHYKLENIEAFFGKALIDAHLREQKIPSIGLFIDSHCNRHNQYFRTAHFADGLEFVYLNRAIEQLHQDTDGKLPLPKDFYVIDDLYPYLAWQVRFLKDVHHMMRSHPDPGVRTKFLTAWDLYQQRYQKLMRSLEVASFDLNAISPTHNWAEQLSSLQEHIEHFSKLGIDA